MIIIYSKISLEKLNNEIIPSGNNYNLILSNVGVKCVDINISRIILGLGDWGLEIGSIPNPFSKIYFRINNNP